MKEVDDKHFGKENEKLLKDIKALKDDSLLEEDDPKKEESSPKKEESSPKKEEDVQEEEEDVQEEEEKLLPFEEYTNKYIKNYVPHNIIDMKNVAPVMVYTDLCKIIQPVEEAFPGFDNVILNNSLEVMEVEAKVTKIPRVRMYLPVMEDDQYTVFATNDEESIKKCKTYFNKVSDMLDRMAEKFSGKGSENRLRIINVWKKHVELMKDPDFVNYIAGNPDYYKSLKASFADMPGPLFSKNGEKKYEVDYERYEKFLQNHAFLDQIEEEQNFYINEYLPYAKKSRNKSLTSKDAVKYNEAYTNHLIKRREYFEEITKYDFNDPDVAANKVCNNKSQFEMDWKGSRYGKYTLNKINSSLTFLLNGWTASDMTFLEQLKVINSNLNVYNKKDNSSLTPDEKKAAEDIQNKFKKPFEDIMNKQIDTPEDRMKLIHAIEGPLKEYAEFRKGIFKRKYKGRKKEIQGDTSITYLLEEVKGRQVFREEIGCNRGTEKLLSNAVRRTATDILSSTLVAVTDSFKEEIQKLPEYEMLNVTNDDDLYSEAFYDVSEYKVPDLPRAQSSSIKPSIVRNPEAHTRYIEKLKSFGNKTKAIIERDISDDEIGLKMKEFFKAAIFDEVERAARGYAVDNLEYRTPFCGASLAYNNIIDGYIGGDALRNNIIKYQTKLPVYDLAIEQNKQMNLFADYYEEKDKAGGNLTPEREEYYRQKIYDQTMTISVIYSKVCQAIEDKDFAKQCYDEKVTTEHASHMHPLATRGVKALNASLDAYKMGLEKGWGLDDVAVIAAFRMAFNTFDTDCRYKPATLLKDLEPQGKNGEPVFASDDQKLFYAKMKSCYQEMETTPITSAKDRKRFLDQMTELIREGADKKYLTDDACEYFNNVRKQLVKKDLAIEIGKQSPVNNKVLCGEDRVLESYMAQINSQRTDLWFSSENAEHKNLRIATENLQRFVHENPNKGVTVEEKMDYAARYLAKLDEVTHYSRIYQENRAGASTVGGKNRLIGAMSVENYANIEKENIITRLNKTAGTKFKTIDEFRDAALANKGTAALAALAGMKKMPATKEEKKNMISLAADVMVGRIAGSEKSAGHRTIKEIGADQFKKQLMQSSEFKSMIKSYAKDKTMTPDKLIAELGGEGSINKMNKFITRIGKIEKQAEEIDAAKRLQKKAKAYVRTKAGEDREKAFKAKKEAEKERLKALRKEEEAKNAAAKKAAEGKKTTEVKPSPSMGKH